jgi:phenylpyruvate tautomerase PptA (4-oxalocrotonate tautomerase family)
MDNIMPVLHIHTNTHISDKSDFLKQTSSAVAAALSKPESYVMILLSDDKAMSFAGVEEPTAFLELKSLGLSDSQTKAISHSLCTFLEQQLHIDASRVYIEFSSPERAMFGWNKSTF